MGCVNTCGADTLTPGGFDRHMQWNNRFCELQGFQAYLVLSEYNRGFHIGWVASEFLTRTSKYRRMGIKVNMTPNGEHQIIGPDRSQIFDAGVNVLLLCHQCENAEHQHEAPDEVRH